MSFGFPPKGWALCNGQLLPINQNQALFSLLGTTYGGDGRATFALPNLQGRVPIHFSGSIPQGSTLGSATVQLTTAEIPSHSHFVSISETAATRTKPTAAYPAIPEAAIGSAYYLAANVNMHPNAIGTTGNSQPHENRMPFLVLNYCIALQGIFPSRN